MISAIDNENISFPASVISLLLLSKEANSEGSRSKKTDNPRFAASKAGGPDNASSKSIRPRILLFFCNYIPYTPVKDSNLIVNSAEFAL